MEDIESTLRDISEIRSMMEKATKFLSLSGLSGVSAGIIALAGAWLASGAIGGSWTVPLPAPAAPGAGAPVGFLVCDALGVLVLALAATTWFSVRMARRRGVALWGPTTGYLLGALFIPLAAGGAFCGVLVAAGSYALILPAMLVFYGLALLGAGNFTFSEVRYLGGIEVLLGITAGFRPELGLIFWAGGFGVLHIVYGLLLWAKYEQ